jgi:hypothetical protein
LIVPPDIDSVSPAAAVQTPQLSVELPIVRIPAAADAKVPVVVKVKPFRLKVPAVNVKVVELM